MAKIFISYAHKDEDHKNALTEHLSPLVRTGLIEEWNDRKLVPGTIGQMKYQKIYKIPQLFFF